MALTVTTSYNDDLGRVQISFSGASADADYAKVEYSFDQITWYTVRGGDTVPLSGGAGHIDHYDGYVFGVPNYYRVTAIDSAAIASIGTGSFTTGNNSTLVPPLPAGLAVGNMMVLSVTHYNTAASITTPTGWTRISNGFSNVALFYRVYQTGDTAPSVAFTGGAAGDSCSAQVRAFSNAQAPVHVAAQSNASAQNVAYPGGSVPSLNPVWLMQLWKQSGGTTGSTAPTNFTDQQGAANSAGTNQETHLWYRTNATADIETVPAGTSTWSGGSAAISRARLVYMLRRDFTDQATVSITPVLPNANIKPYWIMNPSRPGQNFRCEITELSEITNAGRVGFMEVLGRSFPVAVSDVMGSDQLTFKIDAEDKKQATEYAQRLALGEPLYLLTADQSDDMGTFYFSITSLSRKPDTVRGSWTVTVEARVVSQPNPAVYGSTFVWADVVSTYATWADVVAGVTTWSNLVDKVSTDTIIVP